MLKNYIKVAFRNLRRQKMYSLINITCLAIGLAIFILGVLYADFHFRFDRFHRDADKIYTILKREPFGNSEVQQSFHIPLRVYDVLEERLKGLIDENTCCIRMSSRVVKYKDKSIHENNLYYVKENFLTFFSYKVLMGNPKAALEKPNSVVITRSIAEKYFGDANPIGKTLQIEDEDFDSNLEVTGVTENPPKNSSFYYDFGKADCSI